MVSWTFCRPYRSSMSGGKVETNERPGTASQTHPSRSMQEAMVVNPFTEILSTTAPTKQYRASNPWITSSSPFPARLRRFFELLQPRGRETWRQFDPFPPPPRKNNSPIYRLLKPLRYCFVVLHETGYDGPVKRHTVTTLFSPSRRW